MSIYTEIRNEYGINPNDIYRSFDGIISSEPAPWNLPQYDLIDVWGRMDLRQAVGLLTGGDTPTTYSKRMADMMRIITGPSLLGFDEEVVDAEFTRTQQIIASLREPMDAEVVDE